MEKIKGRYGYEYAIVPENQKNKIALFLNFFSVYKDRFQEEYWYLLKESIKDLSNISTSRLIVDSDQYDIFDELTAYIGNPEVDGFYCLAKEYFEKNECFELCHNIGILQNLIKRYKEQQQ